MVNAFQPNAGDSFQVLTYPSRTGTFTTVDAIGLPPGQTVNPIYNSTNLTLAVVAALQATITAAEVPSPTSSLTYNQLSPIFAAASDRRTTVGLSADRMARRDSINSQLSDRLDSYVGFSTDSRIRIDRDAAGYCWFIDAIPMADEESSLSDDNGLLHAVGDEALNAFDRLPVLEHELGHVLDLDHDETDGDVMEGLPKRGTRHRASPEAIDLVIERFNRYKS
jgi:hypothetical protein